jgi:hypothetical protein
VKQKRAPVVHKGFGYSPRLSLDLHIGLEDSDLVAIKSCGGRVMLNIAEATILRDWLNAALEP